MEVENPIPSEEAGFVSPEEVVVEETAPEEELETPPDPDAELLAALEESDEAVEALDIPDDHIFKVKVNGEEVEVTFDEMKKGYSRQGDYTRDKQALAEERRQAQFEIAQQRQLMQTKSQVMEGKAKLIAIDQQLEAYKDVNWQMAFAQDPQNAQLAKVQFDQLKDQKAQLENEVSTQEEQASQVQQAQLAQVREHSWKALANEIEGWNEEVAKGLGSYARQAGLSEAGLAVLNSGMHGQDTVPMMKVLHDAMKYRQLLEKKESLTKQTTSEAKPAGKVKGKKAPTKKDPLDMPMEEYARWANEQEKKAKGKGVKGIFS